MRKTEQMPAVLSMANAIAAARCKRLGIPFTLFDTDLEDARAALSALREPTDGMMTIAECYMDFILPDCFGNTAENRRAEFKMGYQMAIDVALGNDPIARGVARMEERERRRAALTEGKGE